MKVFEAFYKGNADARKRDDVKTMTYELTAADLVWNRATMPDSCEALAPGDVALSSLLRAHGLAMNGGVLHAVELLTADEWVAAKDGFRYFGLDDVADLLAHAKNLFDVGENLGEHERRLDDNYATLIPDDSWLHKRFEEQFAANPSAFAPL